MSEFLDFLTKEEVKKFIFDNRNTNPQKLILNPTKEFRSHIKLIADQILSRQKAKGKLNYWAENMGLILPPPLSIEQASSESTSTYKRKLIDGDHLIDLTGGMGIDCLSLGEKFNRVTYVEQQSVLCDVFKHNCDVLNKDVEILNEDAEQVLNSLPQSDSKKVFYIDPARRDELKNKVFKLEDCTPNLKELIPKLQESASQVLIKLSPLIDIKSILSEFENVKEIHVVSVKNDCKELLILLNFHFKGNPTIKAINLETEQLVYSFHRDEEEDCTSEYGTIQKYVLEPNSSILKSGSFKKIGSDFNLKKLHQHTHLYTSDTLPENFPGKIFRIISLADKKAIKQFGKGGQMNVLTRNYPIKPDALKKKWKLKDGGDYFLIGFKDMKDKANLIVAERIS